MGAAPREREDYKEVCKKIRDLFPNMHVVSQLYALLRDPESSLEDAIELIRSDGVLAAGVVRLSSSVYYGHHDDQLDLQAAVQQVGFQETLRLVGGLLSRQLFMRDLTGYGMTADEYWTYSYYCAAFMEQAARSIRMNPDNAYLCGLLHGIGRVVNNEMLLTGEVEILWDPVLPSDEWERIMDLPPYTEAGAGLLRSWGFPDSICDLVAGQRDPEVLSTSAPALVLDFARSMVESNRPAIGRARQPWSIPSNHGIYDTLRLQPDLVRSCHETSLERVARLQRVL